MDAPADAPDPELKTRFPAARTLAAIERLLERLDALVEAPEDELFRTRPEISGWNPAEHLFHLSLANEFSFKNAVSLVAGKGMLVRPVQERPAEAEALLIRGILPSGAEAPRFVRPPRRLDRDTVEEFHRASRTHFAAAKAQADAIDAAEAGIPHQILGDLEAPLWLRFAHIHTVHHLGIVRTLMD